MDNTTEENMIYLKDLVFVALRRWKSALVAAVALALILGGYKAVSGLKVIQNMDMATYEAKVAQYESDKKVLEDTLANRQRDLNNQNEYLQNSVFMELDPYDHYQTKVSIYVETDYQILPDMSYQSPDKTGYILSAYCAKMTTTETLQILAQSVGTEPYYLSELYAVALPADSNTLVVTILYPTENGAKELLEQVMAQLSQVQQQIAQAIGQHEIRIMEQSVGQSTNLGLVDQQKQAQAHQQVLQTAVEEAETQISTLAVPAAPGTSTKEVVKKAVLFAVLGAIAGVALIVVCAWFGLIGSQKVYSVRALRNRTGVKSLGCIAEVLPRNPIDRYLLKLEGREISAPEERVKTLARDVCNRCDGVERLLITGDAGEAQRVFIVNVLTQEMPGVQVTDCGSILRSPEAVDALKASDKVLLVEQCGSSRYDNIVEQRQKIADYGKVLLGCILIDG